MSILKFFENEVFQIALCAAALGWFIFDSYRTNQKVRKLVKRMEVWLDTAKESTDA